MRSPPRLSRGAYSQDSLGDRAVLRAGQIVKGDYFAVGPHVEISGIVNGDLYVAGGHVLVDGVINGDVIVAGGKVTYPELWPKMPESLVGRFSSAALSGGMRQSEGRISIDGDIPIGENLLAAGGDVQLGGHIGKDARIGAARSRSRTR